MIEEQVPFDDATLRAMGNHFALYGVMDRVGVGLLHKHFKLSDAIMVHEGLTCKPKAITDTLAPSGVSFFWDGQKFQAFEYDHGEQLNLDNEFLKAFAYHIEDHGLAGKVALSKLDSTHGTLMEYCEPATMSLICEDTEKIVGSEATEWKFEGAVPVIVGNSDGKSAGEHKSSGGSKVYHMLSSPHRPS